MVLAKSVLTLHHHPVDIKGDQVFICKQLLNAVVSQLRSLLVPQGLVQVHMGCHSQIFLDHLLTLYFLSYRMAHFIHLNEKLLYVILLLVEHSFMHSFDIFHI